MAKTFEDCKFGMQVFNRSLIKLHSEAINSLQNDDGCMVIPEVVITAFACEIGLKALAYKRGIQVGNKHGLADIYALLNQEDKSEIENRTISFLSEERGYDGHQFETDLQGISDLFVKMRYFYETTENIHFNIIFLLKFNQAVKDYVESIV